MFVVLLALVVGACIGGHAPDNIILTVANESAYAGTVSWVTPGLLPPPLFPATGTDNVTGCSSYTRTFGAGHTSVSVDVNSNTLTLDLYGPQNASEAHYVVIDPEGHPAETDVKAVPTQGCGHI